MIRRLLIILTILFAVPGLYATVTGGFEIGYPDDVGKMHFEVADGQIRGNTIAIWKKGISRPVAVRYGWLLPGKANLVNRRGFPAVPSYRIDSPVK